MILKRFQDLNDEQKKRALRHEELRFLEAIVTGEMTFSSAEQIEKLERATAQCDRMQTPWFIGEYIWEAFQTEIESIAKCECEASWFKVEPGKIIDVS